jgi:hypothetical protein
MTPTSDRPRRDTPIRWANVFFWQMSGAVIGGIIPFAALALWLAGDWEGLLCLAFIPVLMGMAIGSMVGTIVGLGDRAPTFGLRQRRPE